VRDRDYTQTSQFLADFFGPTTTHAVEIRALPNERGAGRAAPLFTREPLDIETHCRRWDELGRAVYFGCATRLLGRGLGRREDLAELPGLWADIDCLKLGLDKGLVAHTLNSDLFMKPSVTLDSGYGIHGHWLFRESLDIRLDLPGAAELEADILAALRQLAGVVCGDLAVCDLARIMRLPATHNTKQGEMVPCAVLEASWVRYEYEEVLDWLDWQRPILEAPRAAKKMSSGNGHPVESDAFLAYAKAAGVRAPLDVGARLAAMEYLGAGDAGVHQTQLHVSASLVTHGADDEAIVGLLMAATREAVGLAGSNWNWNREEKNILAMIASARTKFDASPGKSENSGCCATDSPLCGESPAERASPISSENSDLGATSPRSHTNPEAGTSQHPRETSASSAPTSPAKGENPVPSASASRVIDLAQEREARPRGRPRKDPSDPAQKAKESLIARCGDAVIAHWQDTRGLLRTIDAQSFTHTGGLWALWDAGNHHTLKCNIQGVLKVAQIDPRTQFLNAVYRYILEHPDLRTEGIEWDATGYIVCQDAVLKPRGDGTWETIPHSPDHWATRRVEVRIADMGQGCPKWLAFLEGCFSDRTKEERDQIIASLQEWFGAAMVQRKARELRKALWLYGDSRTGKTRALEVLRALIGEPTSAIKLRGLGANFGPSALIGKRAWIADDVCGAADEVDDAAFKCVVTGEAFSTDVKNAAHQTMRLDIPVAFSSNALPRVKDQSDGVFNRSILIPMHVVRSEEETAGQPLIEDLVRASELAGVFAWALAGWARLLARGMFTPAASMREAGEAFKAANNPALAWAKVALEMHQRYMIDRRDLYVSFKGWYTSEFGEGAKVPSQKYLINALRHGVTVGPDAVSHGYPLMTGIRMTEAGLSFREECPRGFGADIGSGCMRADVNKPNTKYEEVDIKST
jgi:P4 family phage/plasmid primase-like protien